MNFNETPEKTRAKHPYIYTYKQKTNLMNKQTLKLYASEFGEGLIGYFDGLNVIPDIKTLSFRASQTYDTYCSLTNSWHHNTICFLLVEDLRMKNTRCFEPKHYFNN